MFKVEFLTQNQDFIDEVNAFNDLWNNSDEFISTQTSGSTGSPKTIKLKKTHMINSAKMTCEFFKLKPGMNSLLCLSPKTIGGKMMIVRSLIADLHLFVVDTSSNPLELVDQHIDFAAMVPLQVENSLKLNIEKVKNIGCLIIGGAPISPLLWNKISSQLDNSYQTFGMTETISHIALRKIDNNHQPYHLLSRVKKLSSDRLTISSEDLGIELLQTNDEVEHINDREFNWLGRLDFIVNSGGIKLHPEVIDSKLANLIKQPFFCIGEPNDLLGEQLVICIQSEPYNLQKQDFPSSITTYEIPKKAYFYDEFQFSAGGKLDKFNTLKSDAIGVREIL